MLGVFRSGDIGSLSETLNMLIAQKTMADREEMKYAAGRPKPYHLDQGPNTFWEYSSTFTGRKNKLHARGLYRNFGICFYIVF